jgi:hypothetical protein
MAMVLSQVYRLACAGLFGAQLFFAAVAAQVVFPREVAALPRSDARRQLAADLVGSMLARLDAGTLAVSALAVVCAVALGKWRAALLPLAAGLCALASAAVVTPRIHALRDAGQVALPKFGMLHALSSLLLLTEMLLLCVAALRAPESARETPPFLRNGD